MRIYRLRRIERTKYEFRDGQLERQFEDCFTAKKGNLGNAQYDVYVRNEGEGRAQVGVAVAAYYPAITLSASGGFAGSNLSDWLKWPNRFWSVGASLSEIVFEGGLRQAQTAQARAAYDATVASYRETVLTGFQEVEDNLAALRILQDEAQVQEEAVKAARQSVTVTTNQYKSGTVNYLNVIVIQVAAKNSEITALNILGRRMTAAVLLVKALGGGWDASAPSSVSRPGDAGGKQGKPRETEPEPANREDER